MRPMGKGTGSEGSPAAQAAALPAADVPPAISEFSPGFAKAYRQQRLDDALPIARLLLVCSGLLMAAFVFFDQYAMGYRYPRPVHDLVLWLCAPLTFVGGLLICLERLRGLAAAITSTVIVANVVAWLWCYPQMVYHAGSPPYAFDALLVLIAATYTLSGLTFWGATTIGVFVSLGFLATMLGSLDPATLVYCVFFLVAMNLAGFAGALLADKAARGNFLNVQRVSELAERDPLTGLYNRRAFGRRLEELIRQARRESVSLAVLVMDVDHFKDVNDGLGHPFGDKVLQGAGQAVLESSRRPLDCVARLGGDEFVAIWYDMGPTHVRMACESLMNAFARHFAPLTLRHGLSLSMSVGAAHGVPALWHDGESMLKLADQGLYATKTRGRNGFTVVSFEGNPTDASPPSLAEDLLVTTPSPREPRPTPSRALPSSLDSGALPPPSNDLRAVAPAALPAVGRGLRRS